MSSGPIAIRPKTSVMIAPWILHRHRRLWDDPDYFDPERFAPGRREKIHRFAYIPFGAGPRVCIGMGFAMQEAMIILATILRHFRLELAAGPSCRAAGARHPPPEIRAEDASVEAVDFQSSLKGRVDSDERRERLRRIGLQLIE